MEWLRFSANTGNKRGQIKVGGVVIWQGAPFGNLSCDVTDCLFRWSDALRRAQGRDGDVDVDEHEAEVEAHNYFAGVSYR